MKQLAAQKCSNRWIHSLVYLILLSLPTLGMAGGNEILFWNQTALELIKTNSVPPPKASRILGLMHVSMFDAVNSVEGGNQPYEVLDLTLREASSREVSAHAAAYILKEEFPNQAEQIQETLDARVHGGDGGQGIAEKIRLKHPIEFTLMTDPTTIDGFVWEPTPPNYASYLLKEWCALKPLAIDTPVAFRKKGPPSIDSAAFHDALEEVKRLGGKTSSVRTPDQTQVALFWADGAGTVTPPGHWNQIAAELIRQKNLGIVESAKIMALLNLALADAAIVAWDMKYMFQLSRPINLFQDEGWEPLIATPPFPEYVSGHSTFSGAGARMLTLLFGNVGFTTTSDGVPGVTRSFTSFEQAAQEAGRSRIYGGIHFSFSDDDGRKAGRELADHIYRTHLRASIASKN